MDAPRCTRRQSSLSIRRTLAPIGIPRSTFYDWYSRYQEGGIEVLEDGKPRPQRIWNKIPDKIPTAIVSLALEEPDLSPRELAVNFTDTNGSCVRGQRLSALERPWSDHEPGLYPDESGRSLRQSDDRAQPALANRLHLPQGHRLGLVLPVHRARRLLALHPGLEAVHDYGGQRCIGYVAGGAAGVRSGPPLYDHEVNASVPIAAAGELDTMVAGMPPMTGAEYLTTEVLANLWRDMDQAFAWCARQSTARNTSGGRSRVGSRSWRKASGRG